jgi:uncharacterized protein
LNEADDLIEINRRNVGDVIVGNITNPMLENYKPENFEVFMVHYYKALNYIQLNDYNSALVEAKRIEISNNALKDNFKVNTNKYNKDVFAIMFQGLLYELNGEINNAFISYRNAANIFLENKNEYYGVSMPLQLQKDVLRTAQLMGFTSELSHYEKQFGISNFNYTDTTTKELILFVEAGTMPVKSQFEIYVNNMGIGNFGFTNRQGVYQQINVNNTFINPSDLKKVSSFRVAIPEYIKPNAVTTSNLHVELNGKQFNTQLYQNFNELAPSVLNERLLEEVGKAALRQLVKLGLQKGTEAAVQGIAKEKDKKEESKQSEEEKKKSREKAERAEALGDLAGFLVNVFNTASEKADTRHWQSLPATIYYARIPINKADTTFNIKVNGKQQMIDCKDTNRYMVSTIKL